MALVAQGLDDGIGLGDGPAGDVQIAEFSRALGDLMGRNLRDPTRADDQDVLLGQFCLLQVAEVGAP